MYAHLVFFKKSWKDVERTYIFLKKIVRATRCSIGLITCYCHYSTTKDDSSDCKIRAPSVPIKKKPKFQYFWPKNIKIASYGPPKPHC
jgi:hypothetical protein